MADYDLVIRGGTVVTAADTYRADVGVRERPHRRDRRASWKAPTRWMPAASM